MSSFTRVRLKPKGAFHFGGRGVGMEHSEVGLPADSLFSALCVTLAELGGAAEVEALLERFRTAAPFRLTSLMPCAGNVFLLPYPMIGPPDVPGVLQVSQRKRFKEIAWVSEAVFRTLARAEKPGPDLLDGNRPITVQSEKVWVTRAERNALSAFEGRDPETDAVRCGVLWRTGARPRVTVDRATSASAVYAAGATQFNLLGDKPAGLYTVIEWLDADASLRERIRLAFEALGEAGIGGERSSGFGQFDALDWDDLPGWDIGAPQGEFFTTLSPYLPRPEESDVLGPRARYEIVLRRGWLSLPGFTNVYRGTVRLLAEGSVLHHPAQGAPCGMLAEMTPARVTQARGPRVYRYGLAFPVRVAGRALADKEGGT